MENKTSFFDKPVWPVLFVLILSLIFVGILAVMYRASEPRIERQQREAYEKTILSLAADSLASLSGLQAQALESDYPTSFKNHIGALDEDSFARKTFEVKYEGQPIAYVFDVGGKGLWGTMRALVATSLDLQTLLGLNVYDQSETPGLGGRIEEEWFTSQFKGKPVLEKSSPIEFEMVPEGQKEIQPQQLRQITGATITSKAVVDMIRDELAEIAKSRTEEGK